MKSFSIGPRRVGEGAPVFLIAELSANHGQRKDLALRTIEAAAAAGADAIKLQTYTPDTLTLRCDGDRFVVKTKNAWAGRTLHDLYKEAMTPWEWHADLKAHAESLGLVCFSTPFDPTAVAFLDALNVPVHKVASFELNDLPLVERIARSGKPMILSTGMASLGDIEAAVAVCREAGNEQLVLLRCVSAYPAKPESMDLASFDVLRGFGTIVGLSDHTRDASVAIASVALGAKVIEKHFILDRSIGGPDSFFSLEPSEFKSMVGAVRDTEAALGKSRFGPSPDEFASTVFRRSLFVARDVRAGAILTCDDVRSVRPSDGLHPRHLPEVLGRRAAKDLTLGTPVSWDAVTEAPASDVVTREAGPNDEQQLAAWAAPFVPSAVQGGVVLVAEKEGIAIAAARLERRAASEWRVTVVVARDHRGQRLAGPVLRRVEAAARTRGGVRLTALIDRDDVACIRAFKSAGYYAFTEAGALLQCERRIAPYR